MNLYPNAKYKIGDILSNHVEIYEIIDITKLGYRLKYVHIASSSFNASIHLIDNQSNLKLNLIYKKKKVFNKELNRILKEST